MNRHLVIFARAPALGRVKTRLAAGLGALAALRFYRHTLATLLRSVARDPRWRTTLAVTPDTAAMRGGPWPMKLARAPQRQGDLGIRMGRVLRDWPPGPVVIVGADIPELAAAHVWAAFRALGTADVVFGPARDGGYWLVGARRLRPLAGMFRNARWSTEHALADTRANLDGRRVALLDPLDDIDDVESYRRWQRRRVRS